jgi:hypothetical protein
MVVRTQSWKRVEYFIILGGGMGDHTEGLRVYGNAMFCREIKHSGDVLIYSPTTKI